MKTKIKILLIFLFMIFYSACFNGKVTAQQPYVSLQIFYDQLSPYGQWIDNPDYGYVWIPDAGSDFVPYSSRGHWVLTEYGFTWVSDYNWGWAPFHYGRWDFDDYYGWYWIPDNEWGPAWVSWRRAEGYYGWEPMGPGMSISLSFGRQYDRYHNHWIFVRDRDIDRSDINNFYVDRNDYDRLARNSTIINNTYFDSRRNINYVSGPERADVQRATGRRVNQVRVVEYNTPGQELRNGQLRMYRPEVIRNNDNGRRPAPARIIEREDVRRPVKSTSPAMQRNSDSRNSVRQDRQNNVNQQINVNQQNNTNPVRIQNTNPNRNNRREVQQNTVNPPVNGNTVTNPVKQQNTNPDRNTRREVQQNAVNPTNNNTNTNTNSRAVKEQTVTPTKNSRQERQSVRKQNVEAKKAKAVEVKKEKD